MINKGIVPSKEEVSRHLREEEEEGEKSNDFRRCLAFVALEGCYFIGR